MFCLLQASDVNGVLVIDNVKADDAGEYICYTMDDVAPPATAILVVNSELKL